METGFYISEKESNRFELKIARGKIDFLDVEELERYLINVAVDILILRINSNEKYITPILKKIGFKYILAGTLVNYSISLENYDENKTQIKHKVRLANIDDRGALSSLVRRIFGNYRNHYTSNKYLPKSKILEGYVEWMNTSLNGEGKKIFVVEVELKIIAFATVSVFEKSIRIDLNGVHPDYEGMGIYTHLLRHIILHYKVRGLKRLEVATQSDNQEVQKIWKKTGLIKKDVVNTYHINSMLNFSIGPKYKIIKKVLNNSNRNLSILAKRILVNEYFEGNCIIISMKRVLIQKAINEKHLEFTVSTHFRQESNYECAIQVKGLDDSLKMVFYYKILKS